MLVKNKIGFLSRILILLLQFMAIYVFYRYYIFIYRQADEDHSEWTG